MFQEYGINEPLLSDKDRDRIPLSESEVNFLRRPKKYLITGFNGQLGYDIARELKARGEEDILALDIKDMEGFQNTVNRFLEYLIKIMNQKL